MYEPVITELYKNLDTLSEKLFTSLKRSFAQKNNLTDIPSNMEVLRTYQEMVSAKTIEKNKKIEKLLQKRGIRSASGIVALQVLTKPAPCPGQCIFCPNDASMPKSYIKTEPGAMRAFLNDFDPIKQVMNRLLSLTLTGHDTDKIEMIVLGGTRDAYPRDYQEWFISRLYTACTDFPTYFTYLEETGGLAHNVQNYKQKYKQWKNDMQGLKDNISSQDRFFSAYEAKQQYLLDAQTANEVAAHKIIGLTIETRPDCVAQETCTWWRYLGVTRIEMGIQSTNEAVLTANKRGHTHEQARKAVHLLRQRWFKISLHIMPWLYQADYEKDKQSFLDLYQDPFLKPDEIKFYPTSVIPNTVLHTLYTEGKYTPLKTEEITKLIEESFFDIIPAYTRIKRLIRDIPATEITAGSNITNLAQLTHSSLQKQITADENKRMHLYTRLYPNLNVYSGLQDFLCDEKQRSLAELTTIIISENFSLDVTSVRNFVCLDTRSREIRNKNAVEAGLSRHETTQKNNIFNEQAFLIIRFYQTSVGTEYFLSYEDKLGYLYGFCRLLLPKQGEEINVAWLGEKTAIIRELHVYGNLQSLVQTNDYSSLKIQHTWLGKALLQTAEEIAAHKNYEKISVIAGIGVKRYYEKQWYTREGTYMVKEL